MNSRDYWLMREQEALKHYITDEAKYSRRLKAIYNDMMDSVQMEIDAFYGKYASEEGISINAAKKRVSKLDIEAYERKAKKYVKEHDFSKKANEEMKLYNLTMKVNRLELLKANIGLELVKGYDDIDREMNEILQGRTIEELERQAGILGMTMNNNVAAASAIVNASFHNATFSDRIWMHQSLLKAELSKLLQVGLIQGKNPRTLARELRKVFNTSIFNSERLMRTELARVQTEAQKQSYEVNEFGDYEFITNVGCCPICEAFDGKHFKVRDMVIGENAPPMHPNCRCSTAPWTDRAEFDAWLDSYKEHGLNFDEWKRRNGQRNLAKAIDSMYSISESGKETFTRQQIIDEMSSSPIGREALRWLENSNATVAIYEDDFGNGNRGDEDRGMIRLFPKNISSVRVAAQTLIHELGHYYYNIGYCQHAEAICFGLEKLHITGKESLTVDEWEYVKKLAIDNYPEYRWEAGGYGDYTKEYVTIK